ncbi:hypothetical protein [Streptomyces sp. NBC_00557]|uniref:hypothetical protein n=1 Tax=Streptomyces sp. NBC_00557 TaxID=2975776 RepID=UPI003FCEDB0A
MNTPQFNQVQTRLPRHPRPVAPVYQPEVAAQGILHAVDHPERSEHWIGGSRVATLLGQRFASGLPDRYLARTGYDSQQTAQPPAVASRHRVPSRSQGPPRAPWAQPARLSRRACARGPGRLSAEASRRR